MNNLICKFSEGMITLPEGYYEQMLITLTDRRSVLPPISLSRDALGNHNSLEEYIESQLSILKKQVRDWHQVPYEQVNLGDGVTSGLLINYDFLRPDNIRQYQKQAIFTLNMENLLIFSISKPSLLTDKDAQRFAETLNSFRTYN